MEGRRVFVALPAGRKLAAAVGAFRRAHAGLKVRWMKPENLHLTMVPPWPCADVEAACRVLGDEAARQSPFNLFFEQVSFGPDKRRPRLIWATGSAPGDMQEFARRLHAATGASGEPRQSFLLHLTIARFNSRDYAAMGVRKLRESVEWRDTLDALCLYESILKPRGAAYRELCRVPLMEMPPVAPFKK